ncbi:MAG: zinc ribbon domain-containing protein [Euryarchaeota archaeon]|nr:zinc ribbon domain-containing protein [Euryarchaeota archaeon]
MMTMKCPNCNAEVHEEDKFYGECGENLRREIAPKWKWGSMTASSVLVLVFYFHIIEVMNASEGIMITDEALITLLVFGFPTTIYLMYKERAGKIKYGLIWILFPILMLLFGIDTDCPEDAFWAFLWGDIPAIVN